MNWLAKINLPVVVARLGAFKSALLLFSVIGLCLYSGYRIGNYYNGYQTNTIAVQKQRLENLYQEQAKLVKRVDTLAVELEVERLANQKAQTTIKAIEEANFVVKKELAFYQKVMAPEKQADGLVIDEVEILPTPSAQHFRYSVVLVQQQVKRRYAKGYIELKVNGSLNNKPAQLKLADISSVTKDDLTFSFKFFQRFDGEFTLPDNFVAESIVVTATLPKGKWQKFNRLEQTFPWPKQEQNDLATNAVILD